MSLLSLLIQEGVSQEDAAQLAGKWQDNDAERLRVVIGNTFEEFAKTPEAALVKGRIGQQAAFRALTAWLTTETLTPQPQQPQPPPPSTDIQAKKTFHHPFGTTNEAVVDWGGHNEPIQYVEVNSKGSEYYSCAGHDRVFIWQLGAKVAELKHYGRIGRVACSPRDDFVASIASLPHVLYIWSNPKHELIKDLSQRHESDGVCCKFSPKGDLLASSDKSGLVNVCRVGGEWQWIGKFEAHTRAAGRDLLFYQAPNSEKWRILSTSQDSTVVTFEVESRKCIQKFYHNKVSRCATAVIDASPHGIVTADSNGSLMLLDYEHQNIITHIELLFGDTERGCFAMDYSMDESLLATGLSSGIIRIMYVPSFQTIKELKHNTTMVTSIRFLPTGEVISGGQDRRIKIWQRYPF